MTNKRLLEAIRKVGEELCSLPHEDFMKELERHSAGDIAQILLETNALCVQQRSNGEEG